MLVMKSMNRRAVYATATVTGMAALGASFAGIAAADVATATSGPALNTAQFDGFHSGTDIAEVASPDQASRAMGDLLAGVPLPPSDTPFAGDSDTFTFNIMDMSVPAAAPGADSVTAPPADSSMRATPTITESPGSEPNAVRVTPGMDEAAGGAQPAMTMMGDLADQMTSGVAGTTGNTFGN